MATAGGKHIGHRLRKADAVGFRIRLQMSTVAVQRIAGPIGGAVVACLSAFAQESTDYANHERDEEVVDEITVVAPRSIGIIRSQIVSADRVMYRIFNGMTTDRRYQVHCTLSSQPGTRLKRRMCIPNFERGVLNEAYDDSSTWTSFNIPAGDLERHRKEFRKMMIEFADQNPELERAIYARAQLERDLRAARERAFREKRDGKDDN